MNWENHFRKESDKKNKNRINVKMPHVNKKNTKNKNLVQTKKLGLE